MKTLIRQMKYFQEESFLAVRYGAWFSIFWLAARQAIWLTGWSVNHAIILSFAGCFTAVKFHFDQQQLKDENEYRALLRLLTLLGARARPVDESNSAPRDGDNLALWISLRAENGDDWKTYLSGINHSPYSTRYDDVLRKVGAYARNRSLHNYLESLDKAILVAAKTVDGHPKAGLVFGLRKILLNHATERYLQGATHPVALISCIRNIENELPSGSAVAIFLHRVVVELGFKEQTSAYLLDWLTVESWLKEIPPTSLDDMFGQTGKKVPIKIPAVLRKAFEEDREARMFEGGKTYDL